MTTNNKQQTYSVIATTNGYIASRDLMFDGNVRVTLASGLSLDEAREKLLSRRPPSSPPTASTTCTRTPASPPSATTAVPLQS